MTAAQMVVVVKAQGITQTASQIRGLNSDLTKASGVAGKTGTTLESTGKKGSVAMRGLKTAVGGLAAVGGFAVLTRGVKASVAAFDESRKVAAQTNAVIKSTGGAAKVSATEVASLATAISRKAGIDDEAIQSGQNLLLTFKNVKNEVGSGNDIFNQATQTMTDMSVALGQDMKSSSIQLGKALNDPIKGITALQRVGVTFTEQQKEQIAKMVESGNTLKAQKTILAELNSEFGGSAAAAATPIDKMKVALDEIAEVAGSVLVPALDTLARTLTDVIRYFQENQGAVLALKVALGLLAAAFIAVKTHAAIAAIITTATAAIGAMGGVAGVATVAVGALGTAIGILTSPITLTIAAIAAIVAALVHLYKTNKTVRDVINAVWTAIKSAVTSVVNFLKSFIPQAWNTIKSVTSSVWNFIKQHIIGTARDILNAIRGTIGDVINWLRGAWNTIKSATVDVWNFIDHHIGGTLDDIWKAITGTIGDVIKWLDQAWKDIKAGVSTAFKTIGNTISSIWEGVANTVIDFVNTIIDAINLIPGVDIGRIGRVGKQGQRDAGKSNGGKVGELLARGGVVSKPTAIVGEEGRRHPEFVIPTNPAYRARALGLFGSLGNQLGVPGYKKGTDDAFGAKSITGKLPSAGALPDFMAGTADLLLDAAQKFILSKAAALLPGAGAFKGGAGAKGSTARLAQIVAQKFGLSITSGYRSPAHNAAVGGASGSSHTRGSASNPGAHDFVPATAPSGPGPAGLFAMKELGAIWADNHDYGSGLHQHISWFAKGGVMGGGKGGRNAPLMNVEGDLHMHSDADATKFARELGWRAVIAG